MGTSLVHFSKIHFFGWTRNYKFRKASLTVSAHSQVFATALIARQYDPLLLHVFIAPKFRLSTSQHQWLMALKDRLEFMNSRPPATEQSSLSAAAFQLASFPQLPPDSSQALRSRSPPPAVSQPSKGASGLNMSFGLQLDSISFDLVDGMWFSFGFVMYLLFPKTSYALDEYQDYM